MSHRCVSGPGPRPSDGAASEITAGTAVVLAAHGAGDAGEANRRIRRMARALMQRARSLDSGSASLAAANDSPTRGRNFRRAAPAAVSEAALEVHVCFKLGRPHFRDVLGAVDAERVTVIPVFSAAGYFAARVLPRQLASHPRFRVKRVRFTAPLGCARQIHALVRRRVEHLLRRFQLPAETTAVALVGHGTTRDPDSRASTEEAAGRLRRALPALHAVQAAFLDEPPRIRDLPWAPHRLVLPFLIGGGDHVGADIPREAGLRLPAGDFPLCFEVRRQTVVVDRALGMHPGVVDVIVSLAAEAWEAQR